MRDLHQTAGADAVRAVLVLLYLLERNAELVGELRLRDAEHQPARADAAPDDGVDRPGAFCPHAAGSLVSSILLSDRQTMEYSPGWQAVGSFLFGSYSAV